MPGCNACKRKEWAMIAIVGSILFALTSFVCNANQSLQVSLQLYTMQGDPLDQAAVNQPFMAHVTVNSNALGDYPILAEPPQMEIRRAGYSIQTINGYSESTFKFIVRAHKEGKFTLGPATIEHSNQMISSNVVNVTVALQEKIPDAHLAKKKAPPVLFKLISDKSRVVVGEQVTCTLRLYFANQVEIRQVNAPDLALCKDFTFLEQKEPLSGTQHIEGVEYQFREWSWQLYPKNHGPCTIPSYSVDYFLMESNQNIFSQFSSFFSLGGNKRMQSNSVPLLVDPLPASHQKVHGVGEFVDFKVTINPAAGSVGQGMVLTVELIGKANMQESGLGPLNTLPEHVKAYESKITIEPSAEFPGFLQRKQEYIIQVLKPGMYEIPSQSYTYFDVHSRSYKTLTSQPLMINVKSGSSVPDMATAIDNSAAESIKKISPPIDDIAPLATQRLTAGNSYYQIPASLFFLIALVLSCGIFYQIFTKTFAAKIFESNRNIKNNYFSQARRQLTYYQKNNQYKELYSLFSSLAQQGNSIKPMESFGTSELLKMKGAQDKECHEWQTFLNQCAQGAFTDIPLSDDQIQTLFSCAFGWLDKLEKII